MLKNMVKCVNFLQWKIIKQIAKQIMQNYLEYT